MTKKMNALLAETEHKASVYNKEVEEYCRLFTSKQGMFKGFKKTFVPRDGYLDDPARQGVQNVQSTVDEQFDWFENKVAREYLNDVFAVEATNSNGAAKVRLTVDSVDFGELTALELMRLKSILTNATLNAMYKNIPVRSDSEVWVHTSNSNYLGREVFETPMVVGITRTTEKEEIILKDPNINPDALPSNYRAQTTIKSHTVETGDYTLQNFSGEWSQKQKADLLNRLSKLLGAVTVALKEVNEQEVCHSNLNVDKVWDYIHKGE